ncbi:MAG: MBL fold metallo-hydrolase [Thermomicrobiaceae bacterium]
MNERPELFVSSLGSGSNGNAFLIECGGQTLLIDAGVPVRTLLACLAQRGLTPKDIDAALLSHEHTDHVKALPTLLGKSEFPVYATRGTHAGLPNVPNRMRQTIQALDTFTIGETSVTPIPVAHDAREPVGYFIEAAGLRVAIMTDLGEISEVNAEFASCADHLIIESNYDEGLLRSGSYPAYLKSRIRSSGGHLSNDDCASFLREIVGERTGGIWLCHLSENNNRPSLALGATNDILKSAGKFREVVALPRYDGTVLTWRSSQKRQMIQQSNLPF